MKGKDKEEDRLLKCRIHTRITRAKYEELNRMLSASRGISTLSELLRNILDERKIITQTYDSGLDKTMEVLSGIRKELQAIGVNINQITHRFHMQDRAEGKAFLAQEALKSYSDVGRKVDELYLIIDQLSRKWLP